MLPTWLIAAGYAAAKGIGKYVTSRSGGGPGEPGVIYGKVAEGSKFEWLAVHEDYLPTFRREVYGNPRLITFKSFIDTLTESMRRDRSLVSYCRTVFDNLDAVCDAYPNRLLFIWDGR